MSSDFCSQLIARIEAGMPPAVVGMDPRPDALPHAVAPGAPPAERILAFHRAVLPVLAAHVPVVKPNIAFYEALGAAGWAAYEETCRMARELGCLVIGDVKRGDIGSTAEAYAEVHLQLADAVTLHPYLGSDSLAPFLRACRERGKGIFVLVRTSNPSAVEFQDLETSQGRLATVVARAVDAWGKETVGPSGYSLVGAVVGATWADELAALRRAMPHAWLLLPGVGAQGGRVADLAPAFDVHGLGALVSQSRGVLQCFAPGDADWLEQVGEAAAEFAQEVRAVSHP